MTDQKTQHASGASLLSEGLSVYREQVRQLLALDALDDYCHVACGYYNDRGIPPIIAAENLRRYKQADNVKVSGTP